MGGAVTKFGVVKNKALVARLETLLEEAKDGRLTMLTGVVFRDSEIDYEQEWTDDFTTLDILGAIEMLKHFLINPLIPTLEPE